MHAKASGLLVLAVAAILLSLATPAAAQESFVSLIAVQRTAGWFLEAEVEVTVPLGTSASATLTPPGGSPHPLACEFFEGQLECRLTLPPPDADGFASLAALLAAYPAGSWLLSIGSGVRTADLPFAPVAPDGSITVTSPADGAILVSATPTIAYTHDCDTCAFLLFEIEGFGATGGIDLEASRIGAPPLSATGSIAYAELESLEGPKPASLPDGTYQLHAGAGRGSLTTESFAQGGEFDYGTGAEQVGTTLFTVPEPSAWLAAWASAAALGARARWRARR